MKKPLSKRGRLWLVSAHVVTTSIWVGAGVSLFLLLLLGIPSESNGYDVHGVMVASRFVDDYVIIPAALASLFTGFLLSLFTNWGFFRFQWVTLKWVLTVSVIVFGTFWLGPWLNGAEEISTVERANALLHEPFLHNIHMLRITSPFQIVSLVVMVVVSVLKPWKQWKQKP